MLILKKVLNWICKLQLFQHKQTKKYLDNFQAINNNKKIHYKQQIKNKNLLLTKEINKNINEI